MLTNPGPRGLGSVYYCMHLGGRCSSQSASVSQDQHEKLHLKLALSRGRDAEQRLQSANALRQRDLEDLGKKVLQPRTPCRRGGSFASTSGATSTGPSHRASMAAPQPHQVSADALDAALSAAVAAHARAPDLAAVRKAAVLRRRNLQRQLTSISMVHILRPANCLLPCLPSL